MKIYNKRDYAIKISGNHYFACDYVFSNIYGESVFSDEWDSPSGAAFAGAADAPMPDSAAGFPVAYPSEAISEEVLRETLPETPFDALSTLPDCTKKIEYMTEGSLCDREIPERDGLYIRYGSDDAPMCVHIREDGSVSVSGDEADTAEIVFEQGKRNFIALPEALFSGDSPFGAPPDSDAYERHAPIHLCVSTEKIDNRMTPHGGSLSVSYSIEVNGMLAEVSDFTITADSIQH